MLLNCLVNQLHWSNPLNETYSHGRKKIKDNNKKHCRKRENAERIMDDKADDEEQNGETFSYIYNFALCVCLEGTMGHIYYNVHTYP